MFKHKFYAMLFLIGVLTLAACGNDEPDTPGNGNDNGNDIEVPTPTPDKQEQNEVTVYADGSTSTGVPFRRIDDTTFWLNYIKYYIKDGHLVVSDHDCTELEHSLHGEVEIYSAITIEGVKYAVREVNEWEHYGCNSLKKITIPNSVVSIDVFSGCHKLEVIKLSHKLTRIPYNCFSECESLKTIVIPENVTWIGSRAFYNCESLEEVKLPSKITEIPYDCFRGCRSLKRVDITKNITTIQDNAFSGCKSLEEVKIPNSVTEIRSEAFDYCESLTTIKLSENIRWIADNVFRGCVQLKDIQFPTSLKTLGSAWDSGSYECTSLSLIKYGEDVLMKRKHNGRYYVYTQLYVKDVKVQTFMGRLMNMRNIGMWHWLFDLNDYNVDNQYYVNQFEKIYVPQTSLEMYISALPDVDKDKFVGYDPETFDFDSLVE